MTIPELASALVLTANDLLAIYDAEATNPNEPTQKITAQQLADAVKTLGSLLGTSDVVNNWTNTATNKPASANLVNGITSGSFSLPSGYSVIGKGTIYRVGHIVTFSCALSIPEWTTKSRLNISLIPEGFRPNMEIDFAGTDNTNDVHLSCLLDSGGVLSIYRAITTSCTSIRLYATYIAS